MVKCKTGCKKDDAISFTLIMCYIVSGIFTPILLEYVKTQGAANNASLVFSILNSISMSMLLLIP